MDLNTKNFTNRKMLINGYIELLIKSETLHDKLELLFNKALNNPSKILQNQLLRINATLNKVFIEIMQYQQAIACYYKNIA